MTEVFSAFDRDMFVSCLAEECCCLRGGGGHYVGLCH